MGLTSSGEPVKGSGTSLKPEAGSVRKPPHSYDRTREWPLRAQGGPWLAASNTKKLSPADGRSDGGGGFFLCRASMSTRLWPSPVRLWIQQLPQRLHC